MKRSSQPGLPCASTQSVPVARSRDRRRQARSTVHMSSAESTPLYNTSVNLADYVDAGSRRRFHSGSVLCPLARASIMIATAELDRLTSVVFGGGGGSSNKLPARRDAGGTAASGAGTGRGAGEGEGGKVRVVERRAEAVGSREAGGGEG